jgi:glycosyltransferase involved in cell wall biosynthesis
MSRAVTVIIPTYNYARFVNQAVDSALEQTLAPVEVIVVDDGSTDNTIDVLAGYGSRIRVLRQQNRGVAAARNAGAAIAQGNLLAFLDADDVWLPRKLEHQTERFLVEPEVGLVHCAEERFDSHGAVVERRLDGLEGWLAPTMLLFRPRVILGGGSGVMIEREVFREVGGFDERLTTSADWDLYYRVAYRRKVGFVSEVLLRYRLHSSNMHANFHSMEHDMLLAFEKAFQDAPPESTTSRRQCYGNLHTVLAGGFFSVGEYRKFALHALKSLFLTPENITRFLGYPQRWWRRRLALTKQAVMEN